MTSYELMYPQLYKMNKGDIDDAYSVNVWRVMNSCIENGPIGLYM
jgi:hypothetical protein